MNDFSSPRLQVLINGRMAPARVLADLKRESALGFTELRALIAAGAPVLDVEIFTNDWYDGGSGRVLDLLSGWETEGVDFILRETRTGHEGGDVEASRLAPDELRNIIRSGEEERTLMEDLDDLRHGRSS